MDDKQRRRYERLARSGDYFDANPNIFPAGSRGAQALARLKAATDEVLNLDASRETASRASKQGTLSKRDARERLFKSVAAISRTSDVISLDDPTFKGKYRLPRSNVNDQELLAVARSFAQNAQADKNSFIEYDLSADFLDTHNAAIEDFEQAVNQQNEGSATRKGARASIDDALTRAEQELERCDTALRNKVKDAGTLAAWESARRLERAPQKQKTKPVTATVTTEK